MPLSDHSAILIKFGFGLLVLPLVFILSSFGLFIGLHLMDTWLQGGLVLYSADIYLNAVRSSLNLWLFSLSMMPIFAMVFLFSALKGTRYAYLFWAIGALFLIEQFLIEAQLISGFGVSQFFAMVFSQLEIYMESSKQVESMSFQYGSMASPTELLFTLALSLVCIGGAWARRRYIAA